MISPFMNALITLLSSIIVAVALAAIAIVSVQNATLISLRFLGFQSVQLPVGVILGFSAGAGVLAGAIVPLFLRGLNPQSGDYEEDF